MKNRWMIRVARAVVPLALIALSVSVAFANTPTPAQSGDASLTATASGPFSFDQSVQFTPADEQGRFVFLVEFDEPGLLDLHRQTRGEGVRFDARAPDMQTESTLMTGRHQSYLANFASVIGRSVEATHFYQVTHSGLALRLTQAEARAIAELPQVRSVEPERQYFLDTFAGPEFIGAGSVWNGSATPDGLPVRGEGIITAVLDTGIVPNHPSFLNDPDCGHGEGDTPDKLLSFVDCASTDGQGRCAGPSPLDTNGHGTHVAGTVAGNALLSDSGPEPRPNPPAGDGIAGVAKCAHIRNYKVCPTTCPGAQIQAGMNTILLDGDVQTMNFSISGGTSPWNDNDRRKLDLVDAGVFVNASAGNTSAAIPNPIGTVNHRGPWVVAVAASTRPEGQAGVISMTGPGTPPSELQNIVMDRGGDSPVGSPLTGEIRFDPDQPAGEEGCVGFPDDFFQDAIALIQRGGCTFTSKITNAFNAGAQLVVIWNNEPGGINMGTPGQPNVPAYSMTEAQGQAFRDFIAANPGATAAFTLESGVGGDVLAGFSLRGPTPAPLQHLQKPDITAPGVAIYAADVTASGYGVKSGTSMSGPHLSGAAALVRQMQPDWTSVEVGSALRMSASKGGFKSAGGPAWDWDDVGSGRVDLTAAGLAGLVMHETFDNFLAANPAAGGDVRTLNLPALRNVACQESCSFTRTVRNTLEEPSSWTVSTEMISGDFDIVVTPSSFSFSGDTSETQTITVEVFPVGQNSLSFGTLDFTEAGGASPDLHWTLAFTGSGEGAPPGDDEVLGFEFEGTVTGISGSSTWASDLRMIITSPAGESFSVGGFPADNPWDFQGDGSTDDGTYSSSHPDVFFPGTGLDGVWTIDFIHTFGSGVPMTWDPITIELVGADELRDVLATIEVPAFALNGGQSTSFQFPIGDVSDPEIEVDPAALAATVGIDGTETLELAIRNLGEAPLDYTVGFFVEGAMRPLTDTIIDQPTNGTSGIVSTFFEGLGSGAYSSENFELTAETALSTISTRGFMGDGAQVTVINEITWTIFPDNNGVPDGNPETDPDGAVWSLTTPRVAPGVTLNVSGTNVDIILDLDAAGQDVTLPPGDYWLVIHTSQAGDVSNARWNWFQGAPADAVIPKLITPGGAFGGAFPNWSDLTGVNPNFAGLSMTITGEIGEAPGPVCQADGPSWVSLSQTSGSIGANGEDIIDVVFDAAGLEPGLFVTELCIESNDPNNELVLVPVSLEVLGPTAFVQVAHLAPFASDLSATEVDVVINGEVALPGVPYGASTPALPLPAGTYDIQIRLAGTDTVVLEALGVELEDGVKYTAIASGDGDNQDLALDLLVDDLSAPAAGNFKLRLGHLAPFAAGAASADVRLADGTLVLEVDYRDISDFIELAAGSYDLQITAPGGDPVLIDPIELTFDEGAIISAFAVGDGVNQSLGVYALPPDDAGFFVPLVGQNPEAVITPDSFSFNVDEGDTATGELVIGNTGDAPLVWNIDTAEAGTRYGSIGVPAMGDGSEDRALSLPQGFDRASDRQVEPGTPFDAVIPAAILGGPITGDFEEGFEDVTALPGLGWALINNSSPLGTSGWFQGNPAVFPAQSGPPESYIGANFANTAGGTGTISNWLLTPEMVIQDGTEIRFWTRSSASDQWPDRLEVRLSTSGDSTDVGATATSVGVFDTVLLTINEDLGANYPQVWTEYVIELDGIGAPTSGRVAFRYFVTNGGPTGTNSDYIGIDTFSVEQPGDGPPPPPPPGDCDDLTVVPWLSVNPASGTTNPGETSPVTVTVDSAGLAPDTYSALLCVFTNDPDSAVVEVPVSFTVDALFDPPAIEVDPTELAVELDQGDSVTLPLNVANVGEADLDFSVFTAGEGTGFLTGTELFVSGPIITNPGAGVGGADVSALQTNLGMSTFGAGVQQTVNNRMSDVFEVDGNWTIDTMTFFVYQTGSPPTSSITGATVRVWNTAPNAGGNVIFGDATTNRLVSTQFTGIYRTLDTDLTNNQRPIMEAVVDLEGLQLAPGSYWVDVSFSGSLASGPWMPPISILGETTTGSVSWQFIGNDNIWQAWIDTGTDTRQGMPFVVTGSSGASCDNPSDVPWLSVDPTSGTVAGGDSLDLAVTLDSTGLAVGAYEALICLSSNDPVNPIVPVPVTLEVVDPTAAFLEGTVSSLGYCGDNPFAAAGASLLVEGQTQTFELTADENGFYSLTLNAAEAPLTITASAPDHIDGVETGVELTIGETTVVDFDLVLDASCATVNPDGFEVFAIEGAIVEEALTIGNLDGAADLGWSIELEPRMISQSVLDRLGITTAVIRDFTPELNEVLSVETFTIDSAPNGGVPVEFTVPAGLASSGQVVGFTFEGTVAGVSGTGTWASDMRMAVSSPAGDSFSVGGLSTPSDAPWDFQGSQSTNDGTYTSFHVGPEVFGDEGTGDAGDWTIVFTHDWNSAAASPMTWSDVTITLHKSGPVPCATPDEVPWLLIDPTTGTVAAGEEQDVSVLLDSTDLPLGQYGAFICVATSDDENALVPVPVLFDIRTDVIFQDRFEDDGKAAKRALEQ